MTSSQNPKFPNTAWCQTLLNRSTQTGVLRIKFYFAGLLLLLKGMYKKKQFIGEESKLRSTFVLTFYEAS